MNKAILIVCVVVVAYSGSMLGEDVLFGDPDLEATVRDELGISADMIKTLNPSPPGLPRTYTRNQISYQSLHHSLVRFFQRWGLLEWSSTPNANGCLLFERSFLSGLSYCSNANGLPPLGTDASICTITLCPTWR